MIVVLLVEKVRPASWSVRLAAVILAVFRVWTAVVFLSQDFARLSFLAPAFGVGFLVQAALLLAVAWGGNGLVFRCRGHRSGIVGLVFPALALLIYPLG